MTPPRISPPQVQPAAAAVQENIPWLRRSLLVRIAPFWIAAVVAGSLLPGIKDVFGTSLARSVPRHRFYHFLAFGSTALLLFLIGRTALQRLRGPVAAVALGLVLEYAQHRIFGSRMEWWDLRDDAYAAAAAWLVGTLLLHRFKTAAAQAAARANNS